MSSMSLNLQPESVILEARKCKIFMEKKSLGGETVETFNSVSEYAAARLLGLSKKFATNPRGIQALT